MDVCSVVKDLQILWIRLCNEHGTIDAISSDFGDQMTTQHLD